MISDEGASRPGIAINAFDDDYFILAIAFHFAQTLLCKIFPSQVESAAQFSFSLSSSQKVFLKLFFITINLTEVLPAPVILPRIMMVEPDRSTLASSREAQFIKHI